MKILVITPHYPPRHGGTSDYTKRLCAELVARGHVVSVIAREGGRSGPPIPVTQYEGDWSLRSYSELRRRVRRASPDVLLVQYGPYSFNRRGPGLPVTLLLIALSVGCRVPMVVYGHELYSQWGSSYLRTPWHLSQRIAVALLVAFSRRFVVTIEARRKRLTRVFPWWRGKIDAIPVSPTLDLEATIPGWRADHRLAADEYVIAAMGVDDPTKGARLLGAIADRMAELGTPTRIITIGGLRANHPAVESWGYVSAEDAWNLLGSADLFVMPYVDGVSARRTSVLNALAAGAVVLTTKGINTDSSLFPADSLELVDAGQESALVNAAVGLARDRARADALRARGPQLVAEHFSWEVHTRRWIQLLYGAIESKAA